MGQRLNVEITDGECVLANCSYLNLAHTEYALDLTEYIVNAYDDIFGGTGCELYTALRLLEMTGGGVNGVEKNRIMKDLTGVYEGLDILPASGAEEGFLAVTETGIRENRRWENGRVAIHLADRAFDFHVHDYTFMEEYIEYTERVPYCIAWEDLPQLDAEADLFTGIYFDHIPMVRKIVEQFPCGFRLKNGDVIEWI